MKKLEQKFATKDDLKQLEIRMDERFVSNDRFDELIRYLSVNMATKEDIRLINERLDNMTKEFSRWITIVENLVSPIQDLRLEYSAVIGQMSRQVPWHKEVGEIVSVPWEE